MTIGKSGLATPKMLFLPIVSREWRRTWDSPAPKRLAEIGQYKGSNSNTLFLIFLFFPVLLAKQ